STMQAVMAQRLVRVICSNCKAPYKPDPDELLEIGIDPARVQGYTFYHGKGCEQCRQTGFRGRVGLFEILISTPELREMIVRHASVGEINNYLRASQNFRTMLEDGYDKISKGVTTPKEVFTAVFSTMTIGS
ncbi:MAG TPA: hypothetical protein VKT32_02070, partial [Chthonomonadaceae bacterium]|nr:hypothetical protein [Chthonomonadaceae bacterium]